MSHSIKLLFQGIHGAHSQKAGVDFFSGRTLEAVPCDTFGEIFEMVAKVANSESTFGIVPIENSYAGSLHTNYDMLMSHDVKIIGESKVRIHHHLMAKSETKLEDIQEIYSHPQALMQCQNFIKNNLPKAIAVPQFDTAGAAKMVAQSSMQEVAALASQEAADAYGLKILVENAEDNEKNYTRFLVIAPLAATNPVGLSEQDKVKTSIVYALKNMPGALYKSLAAFAMRDIDLLKIESRPLIGSPWEYLFYLDFEGSAHNDHCKKALAHLSEITQYSKILGSYKAT